MNRKSKLMIIAEVGLFAAIGYVLDLLAGSYSGFMVNGGSIGIAMVAVIIMTYRRGPLWGAVTGLLMGLLDLMDGFYAISDEWYKVFAQISLDYVIAYPLVAFSGVFLPVVKKSNKKWQAALFVTLGTVVGGLMKYLSHFLSGYFFWPEFPNQDAAGRVVYSLTYNGTYMIPCIVASAIVVFLVVLRAPQLIEVNVSEDTSKTYTNKKFSVPGLVGTICGVALTTTGVIGLIKTMAFGDKYYDPEYMQYAERDFEEALFGHGALYSVILIIGLVALVYGIYALVQTAKGVAVSNESAIYTLMTASILSIFGAVYYVVYYCYKVYQCGKDPVAKGYDPTWPYVIWMVVGALALGGAIYLLVREKKMGVKEDTSDILMD